MGTPTTPALETEEWTMTTEAQRWRTNLDDSIAKALPPQYNGPLHDAMMKAAGLDTNLVNEIAEGLRMSGTMPDSLLVEGLPEAMKTSAAHLESLRKLAHEEAETKLHELLRKRMNTPGTDQVREETEAEERTGKAKAVGECWIDNNGQYHSTVPGTTWLPILHFPRGKQNSKGSYK